MANEKQIIRIRQIRSPIGHSPKRREVLRSSLGLRRIGHVVEREKTPAVLGAVRRVQDLVEVLDP